MEITESARKHGIRDTDMVHAMDYAIRVHVMDGCLMFVGPARDGQLLEIGYNPTSDRLFHAMPARPKFL